MKKEVGRVLDFFIRMVDPYYSWKVDKNKEKTKKTSIDKKIKEENKNLQLRGKSPINVITKPTPFFQFNKLNVFPSKGEMWYYHDKKFIGLLARVEVGELKRFDGQGFRKVRNDELYIYPRYVADNIANGKSKNSGLPKNKWVDATHLIPFGYHGRENDPRLMVQWLQSDNQGKMNRFEQEVKKLGFAVYWVTLIARTSDGAVWYYKVYRAEDKVLVKKLVLEWKEALYWN